MTLRTRLACIVILFLVGCVFAAPYYKGPAHGEVAREDSNGFPKLQISRNPPSNSPIEVGVKVATTPPNMPSLPSAPSTDKRLHTRPLKRRSPALPSGNPQDSSVRPIPPLELPPPITLNETKAKVKPIPVRQPKTAPRVTKSKSVRITGIDTSPLPLSNPSLVDVPSSNGSHVVKPSEFPAVQAQDSRVQLSAPRASGTTSQSNVKPLEESQNSPPRQWHRVVNGDTLSDLATRYYGTPNLASGIFQANRDQLTHPAILPIGLELEIPHRSRLRMPPRPPSGGTGQIQFRPLPQPHTSS